MTFMTFFSLTPFDDGYIFFKHVDYNRGSIIYQTYTTTVSTTHESVETTFSWWFILCTQDEIFSMKDPFLGDHVTDEHGYCHSRLWYPDFLCLCFVSMDMYFLQWQMNMFKVFDDDTFIAYFRNHIITYEILRNRFFITVCFESTTYLFSPISFNRCINVSSSSRISVAILFFRYFVLEYRNSSLTTYICSKFWLLFPFSSKVCRGPWWRYMSSRKNEMYPFSSSSIQIMCGSIKFEVQKSDDVVRYDKSSVLNWNEVENKYILSRN